jgi:hypothetical protein
MVLRDPCIPVLLATVNTLHDREAEPSTLGGGQVHVTKYKSLTIMFQGM